MTNTMNTAKTVAKTLNLRYTPMVFRSRALAFQSARGCVKTHVVIHGDNAFWVVCPADACKLERAGYEWIN